MSDALARAAQRFAAQVESLDQFEILDELHGVARHAGLNLFGAWRIPPWARLGDRKAYAVLVHSSVSAAFMPEWWELYEKYGRSFLAARAWQNRGAFTMSEALRELKPSGDERWIQHLFYRHGVRDVFYVPIGSWMVVFWSPKILTRLDTPSRAALQLAAGAAAARLQRVVRPRDGQVPDPDLSSRQRAVLRLLAQGYSLHETADHLAIGYETAREHCERATKKLGAKNLPHAIAEAIHRYVVLAIGMVIATAAICNANDPHCWIMHLMEGSLPGKTL